MSTSAKSVMVKREDAPRTPRWEAVTAISSALLALTAVAALIFTAIQLRDARDASRVQHLDEWTHAFDQSPWIETRRALALKRIDQRNHRLRDLDTDNPPDELWDMLNFFDYLGLLSRRGYLEKADILDTFGYWMFNLYTDARPLIDAEQKDDPNTFADFTNLMQDLQRLEHQSHGTGDHPSPQDLYAFYETESGVEAGGPLPQRRRKQR